MKKRCVHNKLRIKLTVQDSDDKSGPRSASQLIHKRVALSPIRVVLEYVTVLLIIAIPVSVNAGIFSLGKADTPSGTASEVIVYPKSAIDIPVLSALQNPNPQGARGGAEVVVQEDALVSSGPVGEDVIATAKASSGEISV